MKPVWKENFVWRNNFLIKFTFGNSCFALKTLFVSKCTTYSKFYYITYKFGHMLQ